MAETQTQNTTRDGQEGTGSGDHRQASAHTLRPACVAALLCVPTHPTPESARREVQMKGKDKKPKSWLIHKAVLCGIDNRALLQLTTHLSQTASAVRALSPTPKD